MNYDANDLKSVLEYIRDEYGKSVFRNGAQMYGFISDFAPGFSAEGDILRRLSERGMLSELEQTADAKNQMEISRTLMKIRYQLEQKMFISKEKTEFFLDALETLYKLNTPPPVPTLPHIPTSPPVPPPPYVPTPPPIPPPSPPTPPPKYTPTPPPPKPTPPPKYTPTPPPPKPTPPKPAPNNTQFWDGDFWKYCKNLCWVILIVCIYFVWGQVARDSGRIVNLRWELNNLGTLTISGNSDMPDNPIWYSSLNLDRSNTRSYSYDTVRDIQRQRRLERIKSVVIKDTVTSIGDGAFSGCADMKSIIIPNSVTFIGNGAFYYCQSLKSVEIPDSVTSIDTGAFSRCTNLTNITIPDSVTYIGGGAFYNCANLKSVSIPANTEIADDSFPIWTSVTRRG